MGLSWSSRKCKQDTLLVAKASITLDIKDDVWLLWNTSKSQPKLREAIKADGFGLSKDKYDGHQWKVVWFHTVTEDSFDEMEVDGKTVLVWQNTLNELTSKWIVRLAAIKDAIAGSEKEDSVEEPEE